MSLVVNKAKEILAEQNLKVTATTARYFCTYPKIMKADWWNKQICCGPIVEQATHFCLFLFVSFLLDALSFTEPRFLYFP